MTPPGRQSSGPGGEREYVPGPQKVLRADIRVGLAVHGPGALVGGGYTMPVPADRSTETWAAVPHPVTLPVARPGAPST